MITLTVGRKDTPQEKTIHIMDETDLDRLEVKVVGYVAEGLSRDAALYKALGN